MPVVVSCSAGGTDAGFEVFGGVVGVSEVGSEKVVVKKETTKMTPKNIATPMPIFRQGLEWRLGWMAWFEPWLTKEDPHLVQNRLVSWLLCWHSGQLLVS